jgi:hypothetical protein
VTDTAEAIARVVADLRAGRVRVPAEPAIRPEDREDLHNIARAIGEDTTGPVVDATGIYRSLVEHPKPVHVYEDHPNIAPPWPIACVAYCNEYGNVVAATILARDVPEDERVALWEPADRVVGQPGPGGPVSLERVTGMSAEVATHSVDWQRVRWVTEVIVWIGGRGQLGAAQTAGPMHMWRLAIYEDGEPADYRWVQLLPSHPQERWDMAHLVMLGALNFMNCRNVDLVEPARPRAERKRLARTGVRVSVINVTPIGRRRSGTKGAPTGVPLHDVRGHFAHYGACCAHHEPRGQLFGKLTGRYWIPQHARGTTDLGEVHSDYRLRPE